MNLIDVAVELITAPLTPEEQDEQRKLNDRLRSGECEREQAAFFARLKEVNDARP